MHTDKKERLATGSMSTKGSALANKKAIWIDQTPGVIEEGKIFFFYRCPAICPSRDMASSPRLPFTSPLSFLK